jgi:hypothetical protein
VSLQSSTQFRRSGQRDDRRRRLMADESLSGTSSATRHGGATHPDYPSQHYGDADFLADSLRLLELVPQRLWLIVLAFVAGLGALVGIEWLYVAAGQWVVAGGRLATFDLAKTGGLAAWFTSLCLLTATVYCLLVYSVRRHRIDDYRGRYRVWLWAAGCCLLAAADAATGVREAFQYAMIRVCGTPLAGDGSIWWIAVYAFLLAAVGGRLAFDMRESWLAETALAVAVAGYGFGAAVRLGGLVLATPDEQVIALAAAEMGGGLLVLLAVVLFARHVLLDAQGRLPRRKARPEASAVDKSPAVRQNASRAARSEPDEPAAERKTLGVDPPHGVGAPKFSPPSANTATPAAASGPGSVAQPASSSAGQKLSKADRKALKQRLLQERLQREQQQRAKWGK